MKYPPGAIIPINSTEQEHLAELLLTYGAGPNAVTASSVTPLDKANLPGLVDVLCRYGAKVKGESDKGRTPLQTMIKEFGSSGGVKTEVLVKLITNGADLNAKDDDGGTALHYALPRMASLGSPFFEALINGGVDLNKKNNSGQAAIHLITAFDKNTLTRLIKAGLDIDSRDNCGRSILLNKWKDSEQLAGCLDLGCSLAARDNDGYSILHYAVFEGASSEVIQHLVDAGADPLAVDLEGNTIIHQYARYIPEPPLSFFLELGVPIGQKNCCVSIQFSQYACLTCIEYQSRIFTCIQSNSRLVPIQTKAYK